MSVSRLRQLGPTPADLEFQAMERMIEIIPSVKLPLTEGLDGSSIKYGPLNPPQKSKNWPPKANQRDWIATANLEQTLLEETTEDSFSDLPRDYLEVSKVLLEVASDDVAHPDKVRLLLKDIREARQSKVRAGLEALNPIHLAMPNLASLEVNELRPFFALAHKRMTTLDPQAERHSEIEQLWLEKPEEALRRAEGQEFEEEDDRRRRDGTQDTGY